MLRTAPGRRSQNMAVVGVGKAERPDQRLVSGNRRFCGMLAHGAPLRADARFERRLSFKEAPRPLVENPFGPSSPKQSHVMHAQRNVALPERKQDIRIQHDDGTIRNLVQDASRESTPYRFPSNPPSRPLSRPLTIPAISSWAGRRRSRAPCCRRRRASATAIGYTPIVMAGLQRSKQLRLGAAEHTTCAGALVVRRNAKAPEEPTGAHLLVGNWHSLHSGGPEVRIEHVAKSGKTIGAACQPLRNGQVLLARLEARKIRARAIRNKDEIVWRRKAIRIGFKRGARYTLTLTGDDTAEISEATPGRTRRSLMVRGTRPIGCLARTAPGWHTRHGLDQEDVSRTECVKSQEEFRNETDGDAARTPGPPPGGRREPGSGALVSVLFPAVSISARLVSGTAIALPRQAVSVPFC